MATKKTPKKNPTEIKTDRDLKDSMYKKMLAPYAVINPERSIINAIIVCSCGISNVLLQGAHGNYFQCEKCGTVYALPQYTKLVKLTQTQKEFLANKKRLTWEDKNDKKTKTK